MIRVPAIRVNQPIGEFYICSIPYNVLQKIAIPDALTLTDSGEHLPGYYNLSGNQRTEIISRRKDIGSFIESVEATFPNTIILAANIDESGNILDDNDMRRWIVEDDTNCNISFLTIPSDDALARIIDGQHRVRGFQFATTKIETFDLPCSVFLDLTMPEQASIFATININQKRVDRSLAFDLFAYNLENETEEKWAPDKLAVFFTRRLAVEVDSPLKGHIKVIARQSKLVYNSKDWHVSTSVIVDGICSLITKNVTRDKNELLKVNQEKRDRMKILGEFSDNSPLRDFYLENNDLLIYKLIFNYFSTVDKLLLSNIEKRGFLTKTIGIAALFDFLKEIAPDAIESKDISQNYFEQYFEKLSHVDFNSDRIPANGQGRRKLKLLFQFVNNLVDIDKLKDEEIQLFTEMINN